MKKHIVLFSLLVTIFANVFPMTAFGQQADDQYAIFNWRNDGDFNAFLNCDVDSITYSKIDLNGQKHSNVVVQEIWTPDSLYRIPLAAIDSVAFRAPEPILKEGIFHITSFHFPYVTDATETTVTFDALIPSDSLPSVGQVVVSDIVYEEPFVNGFAGRVTRIVRVEGVVRIECEEVTIEDIYDELICVGKVVTYNDSSSVPRVPERLINQQGELLIPYKGFSLQFSKNNSEITVNVSPKLILDYVIRYRLFDKENNRFRFVVKNELDCDFDYNWKDSVEIDSVVFPRDPLIIHTPVTGLNAFINIGYYYNFSGDVELDLSQYTKFVSQIGYDSKENNNGRSGLIFGFDGTSIDTPIGKVDMEASLSLGPVFQVGVCLFSEDIIGANLTLSAGPKVSGSIGFNTNLDTWYNDHFDDNIQFELLTAELSGAVNFFSFEKEWELWTLPLGDWFDIFKPRRLYLFPQFTPPALPSLATTDYSLTALSTDISRNLIFPVTPGIELYQNGNLVGTKFSDKKYKMQKDWTKKNLLMELNDQYPAGSYTAKPVLKFFNTTIKIDSISTVTIPEALSFPSAVDLKEGETQTIDLNGGWGAYALDNGNQNSFYASFVSTDGNSHSSTWPTTEYDNDEPMVEITGINMGSASFSVTDLRSKKKLTPTVTVSPEVVPVISVNPSSLSFSGVPNGAYIDGFTVTGVNLSGNLTLTLNDNMGYFAIGTTSITAAQAAAGVMVDVQYRPTTVGTHSATIIISGGGAKPETVTLTGHCYEPLTVSPTTLTFSNVVTNTTLTKTFRVKGYTDLPLSLSLSGTSGYYTLSKTTISPAQALAGVDVTVTYTPTSSGTHNASVNIKTSNGTTVGTVTLNGTAITPVITVDPSSLSFSGVPGVYLDDAFIVSGSSLTGNLTLTLEDNTGYFSIDKTSITAAQAASGISVDVVYKPTVTGTHSAKVTISGGGAGSKTVTLTGHCYEPLTVSPTTLTFSNVVTNTTLTKTFRVKGYTDLPLSLSLSGTSGYYTLSKTTITPAQALAGVDVTVTYTPTSSGTHNASVNIKTSNGTTVKTVSLKGTAVTPPTITVNPSSLSFSGVPGSLLDDAFIVSGSNLTGNLTLTLEDNSGYFSIDKTSITAAQAASGISVDVQYKPQKKGRSLATITISGGGAESKTVTLLGICANP